MKVGNLVRRTHLLSRAICETERETGIVVEIPITNTSNLIEGRKIFVMWSDGFCWVWESNLRMVK